jgi:hypothetical protein
VPLPLPPPPLNPRFVFPYDIFYNFRILQQYQHFQRPM